ncbi:MAG: cation-transporting P-type ATPase, partial [Ktedonobacterales bacterium]
MLEQDTNLVEISGLSEREAAHRLRAEGYNELPSTNKRGLIATILEVIREPMFVLLVAGGLIYLLLGDITEALALLASVFLVIG